MKKTPKTTSQRVDDYEARLLEKGGRRLNTIRLNPEAAEVLAKLEQAGETATRAINRLLIESKGKAHD